MRTLGPLVAAMLLLAACNACGANEGTVGHADPPDPVTSAPTPAKTAPGRSCTSDADCVLVTTEDHDGTCCTICGARALVRASAEEHGAWCREHWGSDHAAHCPRLNCPTVAEHAACESGSCVVKPGASP